MRIDQPRGRAVGGFTAIELLIVLVVVLVLIGMAVPALVGAMRKGSVNDAANAIIRISSQARQFARTRQAPMVGEPFYRSEAFFGLVIDAADQPGKPVYVALTWGPAATRDHIMYQVEWNPSDPNEDRTNYGYYWQRLQSNPRRDSRGEQIPVARLRFNANVVVYTGQEFKPDLATPLTGQIGWMYQYRTGYPIMSPPGSPTQNVNIGVDPLHPTPPEPTTIDPADLPRLFPLTFAAPSYQGEGARHLTLRTADGRYRTAVAIYQIGLSNVQDF